ncbi:MAG: hypothetical protein ABIJ97_16330, partial [Bacteroidota bacterium]
MKKFFIFSIICLNVVCVFSQNNQIKREIVWDQILLKNNIDNNYFLWFENAVYLNDSLLIPYYYEKIPLNNDVKISELRIKDIE